MDQPEDIALFETLIPLVSLALIITLGVIVMVVQFQRSLYQQRLHQENLKVAHQHELLRTSINMQEEERKRIAHDLHDELGARLSVALMQLRQANDTATTKPDQLRTFLLQLEKHLETALQSTSRISYALMPMQLINLGIERALSILAEEARIAGDLRVDLVQSCDLEKLSWPAQLGLYRILSELINNTLKHAEASAIFIELSERDTYVLCCYRDNGIGLPEELPQSGLGLQSVEARASALEGTWEMEPTEDNGFAARIMLPLASTDKHPSLHSTT